MRDHEEQAASPDLRRQLAFLADEAHGQAQTAIYFGTSQSELIVQAWHNGRQSAFREAASLLGAAPDRLLPVPADGSEVTA